MANAIVIPQNNIGKNVGKNIGESTSAWEYDEYDIIDFLEPDYLDYLNQIPDDVWTKYKNDIINALCEINSEQIFDLVTKKIKINYVDLVIKKFNKINLFIFKKILNIESVGDKLIQKLKSEGYTIKTLYSNCYEKKDFEFNKYFYENIYLTKIKPFQKKQIAIPNKIVKPNNVINNAINVLGNAINAFNNVQSASVAPKNIPYDIFEERMNENIKSYYSTLPEHYEVFKYYANKFDLKKGISKRTLKDKERLLAKLQQNYPIDNFDKFVEIINFFEFSKNDLSLVLLGEQYDCCGLNKICQYGDIDYFIKVANHFKINNITQDRNITNILVGAAKSNNVGLMIIVINYISQYKQISNDVYSQVLRSYLHCSTEEDYAKCKDIIYGLMNMGGRVSGYSEYTEYISCIKINKN